MENVQETSVDEINVDGGWLVTHHTRTWDTRVRLDSIEGQLAEKQAKLAEAQAEVNALAEKVASFNVEIEAFKKLPKFETTITTTEATSTPITL